MYRAGILVYFFLFSSCISLKPVMISGIKDFKSDNTSGDKVELSFNLEINNPNRFKIVLKEYSLDVSLNEKSLGKATSNDRIVINRKSYGIYPFKMELDYKDFLAASMNGLNLIFKKEPLSLKVKGALKGRIGLLRKTFPIETTQKIKF